jgi:hypothetical protein
MDIYVDQEMEKENTVMRAKGILYKRWINRRKTLGIVVARCSHKAIKDKEMEVIMVQSNQSDDTKKRCIHVRLCTSRKV